MHFVVYDREKKCIFVSAFHESNVKMITEDP